MLRCLLMSILALAPLAAGAAEPFRVVAFAGASNLPLWAGQEYGLFERRGLAVSFDITPNSVELARNLEAGRYDLALTAIDNIVAYDEGEGEAGLGTVDFVALFGVDDGMLSLVAAPRLRSLAELDGLPVSVDAATTGFAFALREILARADVTGVTFVKVGGGAQRLAALLDGRQEATLLNTPLDIAAEAHGFHPLVRVVDELGAYQGIVGAVRRDRVQPDRARLMAFTRGFRDSVDWLVDPAHHADAVALLAAHMPGLSHRMRRPTALAVTALLDPAHGTLPRPCASIRPGLQHRARPALALRRPAQGPHRPGPLCRRHHPGRGVQPALIG